MANQALLEKKFGLAIIIPWSLVLILGTLVTNEKFSQALPENPAVVINSGDSDSEAKPKDEGKTAKFFLENVRTEFLKIESEEDRVLIYKLLSGGAEYLKNAKSLKNTRQFDPILARVQSSYGWNRESYPEFTDAISDYLKKAGYEEPRSLESKEDRAWFFGIFEDLAQAIK